MEGLHKAYARVYSIGTIKRTYNLDGNSGFRVSTSGKREGPGIFKNIGGPGKTLDFASNLGSP